MFKRIRWTGVGALGGALAALWAEREAKRRIQERPAAQLGLDAVKAAGRATGTVKEAIKEGKGAMDQREAQLKEARSRSLQRPGGSSTDRATKLRGGSRGNNDAPAE